MYEVEIKAHLRNREEVRKKLGDLGCVFSGELHQIDSIYTPEADAFPPLKGSPVLRIREENTKHILTLKINQTSRQDCIEHEVNIAEKGEMEKIIKLLGFKDDVTVDKTRIKTKYKDMEIVLDTVTDLGEFIEVEKMTTEADPVVRKKTQDELFEFLFTLGVSEEDVVVDGKYDIMLFNKQQGR